MGFRINTNIAALNSHNNGVINNRELDKSLGRLSSGLRINTAADDASGMAIADSLRTQASALGQAVRNANDAVGIIQTADKAMDEQLKILDTIKTKAIQAASATQTGASRQAIQNDVNRLIEQLDNIALTTSFNGQTLLDGTYSNKEFQVGAYSNQTVTASIGNTQGIATGNISSRGDIAQLGNTGSVVSGTTGLGQGVKEISISGTSTGLAVGDTIRIDGVGNYKIEAFGSDVTSTGSTTIILDRGLDKSLATGSTSFSIVSTADENLATGGAVPGSISAADFSVVFTDASGLAIGDVVRFTDSAGATATRTVASMVTTTAGQATVTFSGSTTQGSIVGTVNTAFSMAERNSLGTAYTGADYVEYTVEGISMVGVQMTDEDGNGVAGQGLGAVADNMNTMTDITGVSAVAVVEYDSQSSVSATTLAADVTINGVVILAAGSIISEGDTNNVLVDAINANTAETGVRGSLEPDGSLTLVSDGRAMNMSGLSGAANIPDGVIAGTLEVTSNTVGAIDLTAVHYSDAQLTIINANANNMTEVEESNNVADLVYGRVDDNGDGIINDDDTIGLLSTERGAMKAMSIVDAAIVELDSVRADLGSVQNQLIVTVNNISVTAVNVKAAESQIRDVDFAAESANFSKHNILAQSGSYAMSQANAIQQNVLSLLQ